MLTVPPSLPSTAIAAGIVANGCAASSSTAVLSFPLWLMYATCSARASGETDIDSKQSKRYTTPFTPRRLLQITDFIAVSPFDVEYICLQLYHFSAEVLIHLRK
jgi:hypothetical protein